MKSPFLILLLLLCTVADIGGNQSSYTNRENEVMEKADSALFEYEYVWKPENKRHCERIKSQIIKKLKNK
jgi:hypothetical protein